MASMREELAAVRAVKTREAAAAAAAAPPKAPTKAPPGPHESRPFAPVASDEENSLQKEVTTLRSQLDLANSTIGVLRETRDQAMLSHMRFARPDYNPAPLLGPSAFGAAYPPPPPASNAPPPSRSA